MKTPDSILLQSVPKMFYKIIAIVIGILLFLCVGFYIISTLSHISVEQQVQQALDQYCGQGKVSAKDGYYSYDPEFSWSSQSASCYKDIESDLFTCSCSESP